MPHSHRHKSSGNFIHDTILGGQDGLVNVLGICLGLAAASAGLHTILVAGWAATITESISMAAVAFTSSRASSAASITTLLRSAGIVGASSFVGSLIPLVPFMVGHDLRLDAFYAIIIAAGVLFAVGSWSASVTQRNATREGFTLLLIGLLAAGCGFAVGQVLNTV